MAHPYVSILYFLTFKWWGLGFVGAKTHLIFHFNVDPHLLRSFYFCFEFWATKFHSRIYNKIIHLILIYTNQINNASFVLFSPPLEFAQLSNAIPLSCPSRPLLTLFCSLSCPPTVYLLLTGMARGGIGAEAMRRRRGAR